MVNDNNASNFSVLIWHQ